MILTLTSLCMGVDQISSNPDLWIVLDQYRFKIDGISYWIPEFFICDKYSIPRFARGVYPQQRRNRKKNIPAILHDYLVRNRKLLGLTLQQTHDLFRQAMLLVGMWRITARIKWIAVSLGSWAYVEAGDGTPPLNVRILIDKLGYGC